MSVHIGIANGKKEASEIYIGKGGSKKEVSEAYYGKSGTKQIYTTVKPGKSTFTTSGTFTVPKGVKSVDVFIVGGGGGGYWGSGTYSNGWHGGGGGGGYTTTAKGISVTPLSSYSIVVGSGSNGYSGTKDPYQAGASSALGYSAAGGWTGNVIYASTYGDDNLYQSNGGSGGGTGGIGCNETYSPGTFQGPGNGGSDGSNGYYMNGWGTGPQALVPSGKQWGQGQGTTTRAFGESSGTLYAGGGGAGSRIGGSGGGGNGSDYNNTGSSGTTGTGGGGGGGYSCHGHYTKPGDGGSGVVIIRWGY